MRATPIEIGSPISSRTRWRICVAMAAGEPKRWVAPLTSRNASSMEMRSTNGVKSSRTAITRSAMRWYSLKCPATKRSPGHKRLASRPDMPP